MAQKLPVPRKSLAQFLSTHPVYRKTHPKLLARNPIAARKATALSTVARNTLLNSPDEFTKPLGTRQATSYADKLAGATYDPSIRASQQLQNKQIPAWYGEYTKQLQGIQQRNQANYANATSQLQGFQNQSAAVDQSQNQQLIDMAQKDAQTRGGQVDPNMAKTLKEAAASRRSATDIVGGGLATQGANQGGYLLNQENVAARDKMARQQQQGQVQQGLLKQRGAEKSKQLGTIRENERRNILERAAFGLNQQKAVSDASLAAAKLNADTAGKRQTAAQRAADSAEKRRHDLATERNTARANAISNYRATHPAATKGGTPAGDKFNNDFNKSFNKAWGFLLQSKGYTPAYVRAHPETTRGVLLAKGYQGAAVDAVIRSYAKYKKRGA